MATRTAWTSLYTRVLTDQLGLDVTNSGDHLTVRAPHERVYLIDTRTGDSMPHYLQIAALLNTTPYRQAINADPTLLLRIAARLTTDTRVVKAHADTRGVFLSAEAYLAGPGNLPDPALLAGVVPALLDALHDTCQHVFLELEASTLQQQ